MGNVDFSEQTMFHEHALQSDFSTACWSRVFSVSRVFLRTMRDMVAERGIFYKKNLNNSKDNEIDKHCI